ncbi:Holliday junction branch migration DNA helicase RuvB [Candidatus Peregrinibacteria bacterium CG_4_10_14_0_2_um_filter_38_24]|nr:MAG: Holliday junction branch migration DNA helicase RuvB [Candidatus Peregrinibacteria bacterium CG_4_10_14_0_2_um_filter_38_24]
MIEREEENLMTGKKAETQDFVQFENVLRPKTFNEYIGQSSSKENLKIAIAAAKKRGDGLDHILIHGAPGLGKTTLSQIIANEFGANIRITSGPALEKQGDVASIVSNLEPNDILFIDEIHRLKPVVEEVLYSAMEDFGIDIVLGKGPSARTMRISLPHFTLIGATTKVSMLSAPLRGRFGNVLKLQFYTTDEIKEIIMRSARILGCKVDDDAATLLAKSSREIPRIANRLLKRVRDYADVKNKSLIDLGATREALDAMGIDELGLDSVDREILSVIIEKFKGGPVGLNTISAATSEEQDTIEEIYEPFLIKMGFLDRTARGRIVTESAYEHLGLKSQKNLI